SRFRSSRTATRVSSSRWRPWGSCSGSPASRPRRRRRLRDCASSRAAARAGAPHPEGPRGVPKVAIAAGGTAGHVVPALAEADRHLGLANRLLARRARRVCLAFPIPGLVGERYLVTGRPVAAGVGRADPAAARRRFEIAPRDRCLLVFGGSQGARSINETAL